MREKKLSEKMKNEAVGLGLCQQWTDEWGVATKYEMAEKFIDGLDFCIAHNWPTVETIKNEFGDIMHEYGVYADETVHTTGDGTIVINGHCDGSVTFDGMSVGNLYVRHTSEIRVNVCGYSYVHISVYDDASVEVVCDATAKCFVYHYGGKVDAKSSNVIIRERTTNQ